MTEFVAQFGTDNGPPCPKCKGTIYGYRVTTVTEHGVRVAARCCGCHAFDYFAAGTAIPVNAAAFSQEHRKAHAARIIWRPRTLAATLASLIQARANCIKSGNQEWIRRHTACILRIEATLLPSGSGFDSGTHVTIDKSTADRIILTTSYHHMGEAGYTHWTQHVITVYPAFEGLRLVISGKNPGGDWKDHAHEVFNSALTATVSPDQYARVYDVPREEITVTA
jgi:hypothetical protein